MESERLDALKNQISESELKHQLESQSLKERYEAQIYDRDEAIVRQALKNNVEDWLEHHPTSRLDH